MPPLVGRRGVLFEGSQQLGVDAVKSAVGHNEDDISSSGFAREGRYNFLDVGAKMGLATGPLEVFNQLLC